MNGEQFVWYINNNRNLDYMVSKRALSEYGEKYFSYDFNLENFNIDKRIKNPYKIATELIRCPCIYDVAIIDYGEERAYFFTKEFLESGAVVSHIDEVSFEFFLQYSGEILYTKTVNIYFQTLELQSKVFQNIGQLNSLIDVINYIKKLGEESIISPLIKDYNDKNKSPYNNENINSQDDELPF